MQTQRPKLRKLDGYIASRGDRNPLVCLRRLVRAIESGQLKPDRIAIVTILERSATRWSLDVRCSSPNPLDAFALFEMGKDHVLEACGVRD